MKKLPRNRRGSGLLAVILIAMVIAMLTGAYLETASSEYKSATRSIMMQKSINVAESGAEEAIYAINSSNFSGWDEIVTDVYYCAFQQTGSVGEIYNTYVVIDNRDPEKPQLMIEGEVDGRMFDISKQIHMKLAGSSGGFGNGLLAKESLQFGGNNTTVDSYDGSIGPYNYTTNRNDRVGVATPSIQNDQINLQHGDIWGYVATGGGSIKVGKNGSILGEDSPDNLKNKEDQGPHIDPDRVSRDFYADLPDVETPDISPVVNSHTINSSESFGVAGTTTEYCYNDLTFNGSADVEIYGDVTLVVKSNFNMGGRITVKPNSSLNLYIKNLSLAGGSTGNPKGIYTDDGDPGDVRIYGYGNGGNFNFNGSALSYAVLYAPTKEITMAGGGEFFGSVVGRKIIINGNFNIHYDERLSNGEVSDGNMELNYWRELTNADEKLPLSSKSQMAALFAADNDSGGTGT